MPVIKNLSPGPLLLELNSGDFVRVSPGTTSESIPEAELRDNPKIAKLLRRRAIAVATEEVSPLLAENEAEALSLLLIRAIQRIGPFAPPGADRVLALSSLARAEIEAEMERIAPNVVSSRRGRVMAPGA